MDKTICGQLTVAPALNDWDGPDDEVETTKGLSILVVYTDKTKGTPMELVPREKNLPQLHSCQHCIPVPFWIVGLHARPSSSHERLQRTSNHSATTVRLVSTGPLLWRRSESSPIGKPLS